MFCACFTIHHELLISKQTVKNLCQIAFLMSFCEKQNKTKHSETKNKKQTKKNPLKNPQKKLQTNRSTTVMYIIHVIENLRLGIF